MKAYVRRMCIYKNWTTTQHCYFCIENYILELDVDEAEQIYLLNKVGRLLAQLVS